MEKGPVFFGTSEVSKQPAFLRRTYSSFIDKEGVIRTQRTVGKPAIRFEDHEMPPEGVLERLDYAVIQEQSDDPKPVEVALIGGLHADEERAPMVAAELFADKQFPRVEAWNTHVLAGMLGRRGWVRPLTLAEIANGSVPERNRIQMENTKQVVDGGAPGVAVDLNRQFPIPETAKSWEDVWKAVPYPEARLLLQMSRDNPNVKYLFSFHEDPEFGYGETPKPGTEQLTRDGIYFYDMCPDARTDPDKPLVMKLKDRLAAALTQAGFSMFHGVDDPDDPDLGYAADHGYIYQPNVNEEGKRHLDKTFESGMVELGRLGINAVQRAMSFEVPAGLSPERKHMIMDIITNTFVLPFLEAKGIKTRTGVIRTPLRGRRVV